jgi:Integrase core domain/GAG-pre-integrase domain
MKANLYKVRCSVPHLKHITEHTLSTANTPLDWETWHCRFGHVSYDGLSKLLAHNLTNGFEVNESSPKPECITCIEAKQSEKPFSQMPNRETTAGEMTHMDLWGKYEIASINGSYYYLLMVDDTSQYTTVTFLKSKDQAVQCIKEYLTHLTVRNKMPQAIRTDCGTEFTNADLKSWCACKGIDIQMTAPYSPSQNGVAERMNCTLVELARAMLIGAKLPEFLWEPTVEHTAYVRNRSYTSTTNKTPYEIWESSKLNISHLQEFGAPVWTLLQGQKVLRKLLPKSQQWTYIGYDDGSKSIKFYSPQSRKILISRNFHFLATPLSEKPPEEIAVSPKAACKGGGNRVT